MTRAHEKVAAGIRILATTDGSIQDRLTRAVGNEITRIDRERDLPLDLRSVYADLLARVMGPSGVDAEAIAAMDASTASEIAVEILALQAELRERTGRYT